MSDFIAYLHELFADFGPVSTRKMFGGHGVFHDGLMIGLVADDELYLKADKISAPTFAAEGSTPFVYGKGSKQVQMSYYRAPAEALDDPAEMLPWAQLAFAAACRVKKK